MYMGTASTGENAFLGIVEVVDKLWNGEGSIFCEHVEYTLGERANRGTIEKFATIEKR